MRHRFGYNIMSTSEKKYIFFKFCEQILEEKGCGWSFIHFYNRVENRTENSKYNKEF